MHFLRTLVVLSTLVLSTACDNRPGELRLVTPEQPIDRAIVEDIAGLIGRDAAVTVSLVAPQSEEAAIEALTAGTADLALVSNSMPFSNSVATVLPLYPTVLHIVYRQGRPAANGRELLQGAKVFAGLEGSSSRLNFERMASRLQLASDAFSYVDDSTLADVVVVFAPLAPERLERFGDARLFSFGTPDDIGKGTVIDTATLRNPEFRPFVIPLGLYDEATPEPVLTVAVDRMLIARRDLDKSVVYDLVNEFLRLKPALAASRPGLFRHQPGEIDASNSTFVLHPGTLAYLQRDAPSVYERYAGIAEVAATVLIGLVSAVFAGLRIYRVRRKNLIDTFYTRVIEVRNAAGQTGDPAVRDKAIARVRDLQTEAFDLLVDEKLAADESFRIFITLSNDVLRQLDPSAGEVLSDR